MAVPSAFAAGGFPLAVVIAVAVTALVAVAMAFAMLRRTMRLTRFIAGVGVTTVLAILVGSVFVGGSLTQPPAAIADEDHGTSALSPAPPQPHTLMRLHGNPPTDGKLQGLQLPTLELEG